MSALLTLVKTESMSSSEILKRKSYGYGYIYVILFENGVVKIGRTQHPENRIKAIFLTAGMVSDIISIWVSELHFNYINNEQFLLNKFRNGVSSEYIKGVKYDDVIGCAKELHYEKESNKDFDIRSLNENIANEKRFDKLSAFIFGSLESLIKETADLYNNALASINDYDTELGIYYIKNNLGVEIIDNGFNVIYCPTLDDEIVIECGGLDDVARVCLAICSDNAKVKNILYEKYQPKRLEANQ